MSEKQLCIISNGKEISYGLNLYHLFQYKDEKESFRSSKYASIKVDMYSAAAFKHANVSKKGCFLYFGNTICSFLECGLTAHHNVIMKR